MTVSPDTGQSDQHSFINIVNTEINVQNTNENDYGTIFSKNDDYGHLSLTTTVSLTGEAVKVTDDIYERLCMASTSRDKPTSPLPVNKIKNMDKIRKSSLPNLELSSESDYEYLYPNTSRNRNNTTNVTLNVTEDSTNGRSEVNSNETRTNVTNAIQSVSNLNPNTRVLRTNVERSHSQNACDGAGRLKENLLRKVHNSPKREAKNGK